MLILPIQTLKIYFCLFVFLVTFTSVKVCSFWCTDFFTSSVILIFKNLVAFNAIINKISFLISLSDSLLVYRNANDFNVHFISCNFTKFIY